MKWMRAAGILAFLLGLSAILFVGWFWAAVALVYLSFLILMTDVWFEPELTKGWKIGVAAVLIAFTAAFTWKMVLVEAPLSMQAIITDGDYQPGTNINGIIWKKGFAELRLMLFNPSHNDYHDVDLSLQPVEPIAAIKQGTNLSGVVFLDRLRFSARMVAHVSGKNTALPFIIAATDAGYTMHCSDFPAQTSIEIVMALANVKWNPPAEPSQQPITEEKDFTLRVKFDDGSTYWLARPDGDVFLPQRPTTQSIKVEGTYDAALRTRSISEKVQVSGKIPPQLLSPEPKP